MNGFLGRPALVAVVVVLVAVVGGGIILSQRNKAGVGAPASSPSAAPATAAPSGVSSSSVPGAPLPADLQFTWMGPSRSIEGLGSWTRTQIVFKNGLVYVTGTQVGTFLASDVDAAAATMRLTLRQDEAGCHAGDVGDYTWSLAPARATLTLAASGDPCTARTRAFAGTWFRQNCTNTEDGCLGDLDEGVHPSQYITPRRAVGGPWQPTWGALTYTVPAGWANSQDWPNEFSLTPSADYAKETADGPAIGAYHEIWVVAHPSPNKVTADCGRSIDTKVAGTVDALLTWLANEPALSATAPVAITIDGHTGKYIDVRLASTWKTTCAGGTGKPERVMLAYPTESADDAWTAGIFGQERSRVILIDLDGQTIGILIDSADPARFNDLVNQAMPIVQSFKFQ